MKQLTNKRILLGITGGIGAYKSAELVRCLIEHGAEVRVVMTAAAKAFITPLTLQALSGFAVRDSLLDEQAEKAMGHIELAKWADLILIAPTTANCMAKLVHGLADDLLTTLCLASSAELAIAPAMNQAMWHHPATQLNTEILQKRNVFFLGPAHGSQACGDIGFGRMLEPDNIVEALISHFSSSRTLSFANKMKGKQLVITAGPTQEAIDPVRYITNHSSGKMGYALAEIASKAGAKVTLISGPTQLACPINVTRMDVTSAEEMLKAVMTNIHIADIFIGAAAVADYRVASVPSQKIKKPSNEDTYTLTLIKNPDILAHVASLEKKPFVVGFAAETENILEYATQKRIRKKLDLVIANPVNNRSISGFYSDQNCGWILSEYETIELPLMSKKAMAEEILAVIARLVGA